VAKFEVNGDMIRKSIYDEVEKKMVNKVMQDAEPYLDQNRIDRNSTPEFGKYKRPLTKVASIPLAMVESMMNGTCCTEGKKYNLWSDDLDEKRRALVHIQINHKELMAINGTPFALKRPTWQ